jgi:AcrR family transcriptional regulator
MISAPFDLGSSLDPFPDTITIYKIVSLSIAIYNTVDNNREDPVTAAKRIRRPPEEARRLILDAAEASMQASGPAGLRLQDVAEAAGVSHPTVLHHFESREGLIRAVHARSLQELREQLIAALAGADAVRTPVMDTFAAFRDGLAQRMLWVLQSGSPPATMSVFEQMVEEVHAIRVRKRGGDVDVADTRAFVHLTVVTAFGDAVIGRLLRRTTTPEADAAGAEHFAAWFAQWLDDKLG